MISTGLRIVGARINTSTGRSWVCCLILTAALGSLLSVLRVPSGWLIGALMAVGCMAVLTGDELTPAKRVLRPAQGCIGVMAAAPLAGLATATMAHYLGIAAVCSGATLIICLACALVLARAAKTLSPATALLSTLAGGASGISTMAPELRIADDLIATDGRASYATLGVRVADDPDGEGARIAVVTSGGAANAAGLPARSVVTKIDNEPIDTSDALVAAVRAKTPGARVTLTYLDPAGATKTVQITLGTEQTSHSLPDGSVAPAS